MKPIKTKVVKNITHAETWVQAVLNAPYCPFRISRTGTMFEFVENNQNTMGTNADINDVLSWLRLQNEEQEKFKEGMTFKINTRRSYHNYQYDTNEMNDILGSHILREVPGIKVKMKNPDMTLRCEVRADGIYLSHEKIDGAGGLPVGTAGKAMLMLSGGIDSPVAAYLMMKRGVSIECIHFASPPSLHGGSGQLLPCPSRGSAG